MTQPAVPSAVSYEEVREGNDSYRAFGPWTHRHQTGIAPVRDRGLCQHHDGEGTRMGGTANPGERTIHIVTDTKPKVLEGLSPKGTGVGTRSLPFLVMDSNAPGGQRAPTPRIVPETEHGNPVRLPRGKAHRKASREACGKRRREEAHATLSWGGEALSIHAISLHAKAR